MAKRKPHKRSASSRKGTPKNKPSTNLTARLRSWWSEKSPVLRFTLAFLLLLGLFYAFYFSSLYQETLLPYAIGWQTQLASGFLNLLGYGTSIIDSSVISGEQFSVNVKNGCDGLEAIALLVVSIVCIPLAWRYKWQGILAGVGILLFLNIFRIAGLFLAGIHWPSAFDFLHLHGGFVIFTLASLTLVIIWATWAIKKQQVAQASAT